MISPYCYPGTFRNKPLSPAIAPDKPALNAEQIADLVADYYRIPMEVLQSKAKTHRIARARLMAWHFMKIYCPLTSQIQCAAIFRRVNHTTVLSGRLSIKNLIDTDDSAKFEAQHLDAIIKANTQ